jgi:hypothetical protein
MPIRRQKLFHLALLSPLLLSSACRGAASAFGPTASAARTNADEFFTSIALRFTNVERSPKFLTARERFGKYALTPSKLFDDSVLWTGIQDDTRSIGVSGLFNNNRYLLATPGSARMPDRPGDSRHFMQLRHLVENDYEWQTSVDMAVGKVTAPEFANAISRAMAGGESRAPQFLRAEYRSTFPKTTAALGELFSLDTLTTTPDQEGATTIVLGIRLLPEKIRPTSPAFADYLDKYFTPAQYRLDVTDRRGDRWFEISGRDNLMMLRFRSMHGHFMPLGGGVRTIPDTLQIRMDAITKILLFHVGVRNLVGELRTVETAHERGWYMRFMKEPDWKLPPTVRYLIRKPLRRPFEAEGTLFSLSINDHPGSQTLTTKNLTTTVRESAILRFLGKLGGTARGDFVGKVETEENKFLAGVFEALRADTRA